jgi:hypothetical protein
MKKKEIVLSAATILAMMLSIVFCTQHSAQASSTYLDGKLTISGFLKQQMQIRTEMPAAERQFHSTNVDFFQTSGLFETLYKIRDCPDYSVSIFTGFKAWWQESIYYDHKMSEAIPRDERQNWTKPESFENDILTEAYLDIIKGPWQLRLGKQILVWGQLDLERVADVVNPIDIRRGPPGVNTWEEVKQGLWMIRTLYQSELPGDLLFETVFNPGDFKPIELPYEGAQPGVAASQVRFLDPKNQKFGIYYWNREKWSRDAPSGWSLRNNWEAGFRIRGNTFDIDWTLLYWNARDDAPVADPKKVGPFNTIYLESGIRTAITGQWAAPEWPSYKVYYYKRYQTVGGTAQTFSPKLWNTIWRLEWFFEINRPLNKATLGDPAAIYGLTKRNILGIAVQCGKTFNIPWFTRSFIANSAMTDISFTYGWEKVFNYSRDLTLDGRNHGWKNSSNDVVTFFMQQPLLHQTYTFVMLGNYYLRTQKWQLIPVISYAFPGIHWRADAGYVVYGGSNHNWVKSSSTPNNDYVLLRLRCEF